MPEDRRLARRCFDLFLISFAVLFVELAAIRWFPAYVATLTFFTNFVLMAAFVGMSVGCLAAGRRITVLDYLPSLMAVTCAAALAVYVATGFMWLASVKVGNAKSPEMVYFGTERSGEAALKLAIPVELVLGFFFVLIALWFIGLGQVLGRKLAEIENRILAYTVNIAGSLAGIVAFGVLSYWELPPVAWFIGGIVPVLYFLRQTRQLIVPNLTLVAGTLALVGVTGWRTPGHQFYWSPYYSIRYSDQDREIVTNGITHQKMVARTEGGLAYSIPYVLRREAGLAPIEDVLVIGAGSGNDVSHALAHEVKHVDAVEIDPTIARLGREHHPNRPYSDSRVRLTINDGRAFLRNTDRQYDLVVYAVVDSLTLHSSFSSIRLENFLFTREAFSDIRRRLKPGGVFAAYNFYRQGWIVARLHQMMEAEFGCPPVLLSLPPRPEIRDTESEETHMAVLLAGDAAALDPIRRRLETSDGQSFHASDLPAGQLRPARLVTSQSWRLPTDDWPFLYLREPKIPAHNWRGLALLLGLSLGLLLLFAPSRPRSSPDAPGASVSTEARETLLPRHEAGFWADGAHFFFLGAGFMLIETKSVTQTAQLFGSTWFVNSIVFGAILILILFANLYVLMVRPRRMIPYYVGLALTLLASWLVPLDWLLSDSVLVRAAKASLVLLGPILFAGVVFATSFARTRRPDWAFGANIAGVVLGGLLEYASLVVGYRHLLLLAAGLYVLSTISAWRRTPAATAECQA
jgi:SAM-dependent methyltransferase